MLKKITLSMLAIVALSATSCKKDKNENSAETTTTVTTVAEDKANIKASLDGVISCMETFKSGDFVSNAVNFLGMSGGTANEEAWVSSLFDSLFVESDFDYLETENKFILANHFGTYTYNIQNSSWTRTKDVSDKAVFNFPSNKSVTANDMKLIVGSYSDSQIMLSSETVSFPKTGAIQLYKNNIEIANVILNNFNWEATSASNSIPTKISGSVMLAPFTYKFEMNRTTPTEFVASVDVSSSSSCGYHVDATLKLNNTDYDDVDEEDINNLNINFKYGSFAVKFDADVDGIAALGDNATAIDVNKKVKISVLFANMEIGNIHFVEDGSQLGNVQIMYKDNSSENLDEAYLNDFFNKLENVFQSITGGEIN